MKSKKIFYGKHFIDQKNKISVFKSLNERLISGGNVILNFEKKLSKYLGSKYTISCSSGTAALHMIFTALNLKKTDSVIIPAINFVAVANILSILKIKFYLADVDKSSGQVSAQTIKNCIKKNKIKNLKVVVLSYLGGYVYDIENIIKLKKTNNFKLVEDSCHAFGSKYLYKKFYYKVGSSKHTDFSAFSFHPVKSITTGEGGLVTTNNKKFAEKIKIIRSHGIERSKNYWNYDIKYNGFNYRLSDINAALGISQLKKVKKFLIKRKNIAQTYNLNILQNKIIKKPFFDKNSSWHLYIIRINFSNLKINRNNFIKYLNKKGIYPQIHYKPIYRFVRYKKYSKKKFPLSEKFFSECLSLPIYPSLKKKEVFDIIKHLENIIKKFKKN